VGWARAWLDRARELIDRLGQGVCVPELHHIEAEVLHAEGAPVERVLETLAGAVEACCAQGAQWSEQRSAALLALRMGCGGGDP
jgi:hypothetical protein